jgi:hypothetical protein
MHTCVICHVQFGVAEDKMMERLWGDNFFDPKTKKWTKKHTGTDTCQWVPSLHAIWAVCISLLRPTY